MLKKANVSITEIDTHMEIANEHEKSYRELKSQTPISVDKTSIQIIEESKYCFLFWYWYWYWYWWIVDSGGTKKLFKVKFLK